ncbi:MAG TPA: hypothetical protein VKB76_09360 [Ktedonobacterales bacterium]|nr:hypothetical protein [Ktedonobacterales bacterium]
MKTLLAAAAVAATIATAPVQAAQIFAELGASCPGQQGTCRIIHIEGRIEAADWQTFKALALAKKTHTVVQLNSPGGLMESGLIVGVGIQTLGFDTYVGPEAECASVCASIWLAGKTRYAAGNSAIGFHQPYAKDARGRIFRDPAAVNMQKKYYAEIGVPKPAADFFVAADPKDIYWLNDDLAKGFGIQYTLVEPTETETPAEKPAARSHVDGSTVDQRWPMGE